MRGYGGISGEAVIEKPEKDELCRERERRKRKSLYADNQHQKDLSDYQDRLLPTPFGCVFHLGSTGREGAKLCIIEDFGTIYGQAGSLQSRRSKATGSDIQNGTANALLLSGGALSLTTLRLREPEEQLTLQGAVTSMSKPRFSNVKRLSSNLQEDHRRSLTVIGRSATRSTRVGPATTRPPYEFRYASGLLLPKFTWREKALSCTHADFQICKLRVEKRHHAPPSRRIEPTRPKGENGSSRSILKTLKADPSIGFPLHTTRHCSRSTFSLLVFISAADRGKPKTSIETRVSKHIVGNRGHHRKSKEKTRRKGLRGASDAGRGHRPPGVNAAIRVWFCRREREDFVYVYNGLGNCH
ncbi:hypothetical protein YC2023_001339 [Brassica napus]